jgi:AraC family transcriptional regulator
MEPRFVLIKETLLAGSRLRMSFANNKTKELWQRFMPKAKQISGGENKYLYSVEVFDSVDFFNEFNPVLEFEKWAAVKLESNTEIPDGIELLKLPEGLYAVFIHKGPASDGAKTYNYIFTEWLPSSDYTLDHRPHFALMGEKYKNESVDSEEEIWIPVQKRN